MEIVKKESTEITVIKTSLNKPPRLVLYGEHKIGKSSFGASCPEPIFLRTEDGADSLSVSAFPLIAPDYAYCRDAVESLLYKEHKFKTLVVDSLDWMEKLVWDHCCKEVGATDIAAIPYGRGYKLAEKYWREFLDLCSALNTSKKMVIVLLAHSQIKRFEDPEHPGYDKFTLDLHQRASALVAEWCDVLSFCSKRTMVEVKDAGFGQKVAKAKTSNERIMHLEPHPAHDAGNRYGLPPVLPLSWSSLVEAMSKNVKQKE